MNKEVLISVKGLQFSVGEHTDTVETINKGEYYKKDDKHYILFDEVLEGFDNPVRNLIKCSEGSCIVNKKGVINVNMLFEEKKRNLTNYATPFGGVMIGIDTYRIELEESEEELNIRIDYALEANYEHLANCKLEIAVRNQKEGISLS
ncbi:MAG: DUF1934 domain-containing protein [Lachnospiraceae bacterium]|jgi:uncharacterized beta-barrel protein YwiB (DUF1934 family)|nr:DUF1934 domain-containing protein [Lachnospiraceae bacterium]